MPWLLTSKAGYGETASEMAAVAKYLSANFPFIFLLPLSPHSRKKVCYNDNLKKKKQKNEIDEIIINK